MMPLLEASGIGKRFGGVQALSGVSFGIARGEIYGMIGPNGAGKTTLFKLITGLEQPDAGTFKVGDTVKTAYVEQSRDSLQNDPKVIEVYLGR